MAKVLLIVVLVLIPLAASAQVAVQIVHSGYDTVGQRLVFYYKEAIRRSSSFRLVLDDNLGLRVRVVTLEPAGSGGVGYSTVYSATWTWNNPDQLFDFYLTQVVGTCGSSRVHECAENLLVETNNQLERLQRLFIAAPPVTTPSNPAMQGTRPKRRTPELSR